jgi:putative ABC transport system permease protein
LTALGILIGIAAVVIVTALGTGARQQIGAQIEKLGSNLLFVWSRPATKSGARVAAARPLTDGDAEALRREATALAAVTVWTELKLAVSSPYASVNTGVMGVDLHYFGVRDVEVESGRAFSQHELQQKAKVVLLGRTVQENLFGTSDPIGRIVRINRYPFQVIGTLKSKGFVGFEDQDNRVMMPIGSWRSRILPGLGDRVFVIMAAARSAEQASVAERQIESILRQRHRIREGEDSDFQVASQKGWREQQDAIFDVLTALLSSVAAIALFVGGVGVMNIMLVSVAERTREIGVRMAIGARRRDIQLQFLCEAVALTSVGGLSGLAIAAVALEVFGRALEWPLHISLQAVGMGLAVSVAVGIAFGLLPARRAARLDPIEALRHE